MGDTTSDVIGAEEIRRIERDRVSALVSNDFQTADRLHAPDSQLIPPSGQSLTNQRYLDLLASGNFQYIAFGPAREMMVRRHDMAAIIRY
jgi:hypothetical protein